MSRLLHAAVVWAAFLCLAADEKPEQKRPKGATVTGNEVVLFDFEKGKLSIDWSAIGEIEVTRKEQPVSPQGSRIRPERNGLSITTKGNAGVFAKSGRVPKDWTEYSEISFWVFRDAEEAKKHPKSILEVQIYESDGKARFWRKFEVNHTGWKRISLPLTWFRWGSKGRIPRWDQIDRFGYWFRDQATLSIDSIWIKKADPRKSAYPSIEQIRKVAFPGLKEDRVRSSVHANFAVVTDAEKLKLDTLSNHLGELTKAVRSDFPFFDKPRRRPVLLVFSTREAYQAFTPRLAKQMNSVAELPKLSGYTVHGVATSFWNKEYGTLRPIYTHEFVHSLLAHIANLPNREEWFQEGTATRYQLRFHPQENFDKIVREGLSQSKYRLPLKKLCSGEKIPRNRHWQAMTVVELLLSNVRYRKYLPRLCESFQKSGSTNLQPHIQSVLKTNWDEFERDWKNHCRARYGADKKPEKVKEPAPTTAQIQTWIKQLGDDDFKVREEATRNLIQTGEPAFDAVTKATVNEDAEVRQRAMMIIKQLKKAAIAYFKKLGGKVTVDKKSPGKPMIGLHFAKNNVTDGDLVHLKGFTNLKTLDLTGTQVTDISPLRGLLSIENLTLTGTQVKDISPLAGLSNLKYLALLNAPVNDISPLKGLTNLRELKLYGTPVKNIAPLEGLTSLNSLDLRKTQVTDLSSLASLTKLKRLYIGGTQVNDITPLVGLTNLKTLHLLGTPLSDLSSLERLTHLDNLILRDVPIKDPSRLAGLTQLKRIVLIDTLVSKEKEEVQKLIKALPKCDIDWVRSVGNNNVEFEGDSSQRPLPTGKSTGIKIIIK